MVIVRENTEGEYSSVGGRMFEGTEREFVLQEAIFTRTGVDRVLKFAFELAQKRPKKHLTSATKSNGISISMPYWDERVDAMGSDPRCGHDKYHIDILPRFVLSPERFDVVVAPTCSAISCPTWPGVRRHHRHCAVGQPQPGPHFLSLFEPVHGSAPDIYGQNIANPIAMIWCGAMMLDFLGHSDAHDAIVSAVERCLVDGPRTPDMGGTADTT
jgi:tartrate dehydrogenase/decarboxylase/D-malate dehydrogenase